MNMQEMLNKALANPAMRGKIEELINQPTASVPQTTVAKALAKAKATKPKAKAQTSDEPYTPEMLTWVRNAIKVLAAANVNRDTGKPYSKGINLKYNPLHRHLAAKFGLPISEDHRDPDPGSAQAILRHMAEDGHIVMFPVKGGFMAYLAEDKPKSQSFGGTSALTKAGLL